MTDTDCRKCKAPMPPQKPIGRGFLAGVTFKVTAYRCPHCDHWNDLKRRAKKATQEPQ